MKERIFSPGETITIQTNLNNIEKSLGRPIPGGMIDASNLKDHILRTGEISTICQNINNVKRPKNNYYTNNNNSSSGSIEGFLCGVVMLIGFIAYIFDLF